jgi:hypothetical protein
LASLSALQHAPRKKITRKDASAGDSVVEGRPYGNRLKGTIRSVDQPSQTRSKKMQIIGLCCGKKNSDDFAFDFSEVPSTYKG